MEFKWGLAISTVIAQTTLEKSFWKAFSPVPFTDFLFLLPLPSQRVPHWRADIGQQSVLRNLIHLPPAQSRRKPISAISQFVCDCSAALLKILLSVHFSKPYLHALDPKVLAANTLTHQLCKSIFRVYLPLLINRRVALLQFQHFFAKMLAGPWCGCVRFFAFRQPIMVTNALACKWQLCWTKPELLVAQYFM